MAFYALITNFIPRNKQFDVPTICFSKDLPTYLSPVFHPGKSCKSNGNLIICKWISRSQVREATERQSFCLFPLDINSIQHG